MLVTTKQPDWITETVLWELAMKDGTRGCTRRGTRCDSPHPFTREAGL
jgi:hypothetical protein